jgi:hypothetical protein
MTAVISLFAHPDKPAAAAEVIAAVSGRLAVDPRLGDDGSWEFTFGGPYGQAHARVTEALAEADPDWPAKLTLHYALAI